jgi:hypothetical protein
MDVPRFTRAELNAHLVDGDLEEAFSRFASETREKLFDEVSQPIRDWLGHENNRLLPEAWRVYRTWLNATGDTVSIEKPLAEWLAVNDSGDDADRVFRAWLQAGGRFAFIREHVFEWLRTHSHERNAVYVLKDVVKQRIIPDDVTLKILAWCARFSDDRDAIWRLTELTAHVGAERFVEAVRASASVLEPLFANPNLPGITRSQITTVLGNLATLEDLASHPASRDLDVLLCRWMDHPQSFEPSRRHGPYHQTRPFLIRLLAAAESETPTPDLSPLIEWIGAWDEQPRLQCKDLLKRARVLRHTSTGGRPRRP